jgi:hypothetical protein
MLQALIRKISTVAGDPVLQRWLIGRATGKWPARPMIQTRPPYLAGLSLGPQDKPDLHLTGLPETAPTTNIEFKLAGLSVTLTPGDVARFMGQVFGDTECLLALHRFAWIAEAKTEELSAWVNALYTAWFEKFGVLREGWAWHPYTAAERLINLLAFSKQYGAPGEPEEFLNFLYLHGPAINDHLEYFSPEHTGNHLANNGRGLYLSGLGLGLKSWVEIGRKILLERGAQIFTESGLLREGSSHYHLLTTRWYNECWQAAEKHNRPEAAALKGFAEQALAASQLFNMPGGFPLIGDVSPDCSPAFLIELNGLKSSAGLNSFNQEDWLRKDTAPWSLLTHNAAEGWSYLPGHGHQDFGGFELHHNTTPIFQDLGRRSYGPSGESDVGASAHNTLMIDGATPYPVNRPYYNDAFRSHIAGPKPTASISHNSITISSKGFGRFKGITSWQREWVFEGGGLSISDTIDGRGLHKIERFFHTALPVTPSENEFRIGALRASLDGHIQTSPSQKWGAYGEGEPATSITVSNTVDLPWSSTIKLEMADD